MAPPSALRAATSPSLRNREDQEGRHKTASELSSNCRDFDSHAVTILLSTPGAARGCFRSATWHRFPPCPSPPVFRSEEHTSELQSLMRISYAVFCLKKKTI